VKKVRRRVRAVLRKVARKGRLTPHLRLNLRHAEVTARVAGTATAVSASSRQERVRLTRAALAHAQALGRARRARVRAAAVEVGLHRWHALPGVFDALLEVADAAGPAGESELAVHVYRLLTTSRPASPESWRGLATALDGVGEYGDARVAAQQYARLTGEQVALPNADVGTWDSPERAAALDADLARLAGDERVDDVVAGWARAEAALAAGAATAQVVPVFAAALATIRSGSAPAGTAGTATGAASGFGGAFDALVTRTLTAGEPLSAVEPVVDAVVRARPAPAASRLSADDAVGLRTIELSGLREYLAGKSVCLVANSARLLEHRVGDFVDEHDVVVRFNSFALDAPRTGTRTDVHATIHLHDFNWSHPVDVRLVFSGKRDLWRSSVVRHVDPPAQRFLGDESLRWPARTLFSEEDRLRFKVPTTGFNVLRIIDFLDVSTAIDLVGFDFYSGGAYRLAQAMHLPVAAAHSYDAEKAWVMERAVSATDITISLR